MISMDKLKGIKHLVTHAGCPDGIASALIIKDALPDVRVSFVKHGTEEHRTLEPAPGTLFCDFAPHGFWLPNPIGEDVDSIKMWLEAGALVLDHHPTQRELTMTFVEAGLGVYGENDRNECGAWLAYEHVWLPLKQAEAEAEAAIKATPEVRTLVHGRHEAASDSVYEFASLAGVRDTWKKDDPRWQAACEQAELLMFFPWGSEGWPLKLNRMLMQDSLDLGTLLFEKKLEHARSAIGEAHCFQSERGTRVLMFQGVTPTSDAAEILEKKGEPQSSHPEAIRPTNIVAGFHYRVDAGKLQLQFSTRSHTGYDVGSFCKAHGGGGHKTAAGFTVEQSAEVGANPYAVFRLLLEEWEAGR